MSTTLSPSVLPKFISARIFSFPQVENEVKLLKKVQKEEISAAFQKVYYRAKACIYVNGA
jgi:hypothetical protein